MSKPWVFNHEKYNRALEQIADLEREVDALKLENQRLQERNHRLDMRLIELRSERTNLEIKCRILEEQRVED